MHVDNNNVHSLESKHRTTDRAQRTREQRNHDHEDRNGRREITQLEDGRRIRDLRGSRLMPYNVHATRRRMLRLHVVGDCADDAAALIVSAAAARYSARSGQPVWTYTHAWRTVARESWGSVSVRASCETVEQLAEARARGYSGAIVVAEHVGPKTVDGITPCPQQTKGTTCADCRLCFTARATIAFEAHGSKASTVRATLA